MNDGPTEAISVYGDEVIAIDAVVTSSNPCADPFGRPVQWSSADPGREAVAVRPHEHGAKHG